MNWQEKLAAAERIALALKHEVHGKGNEEQYMGDILEIVARLLLPGLSMQLVRKSRKPV